MSGLIAPAGREPTLEELEVWVSRHSLRILNDMGIANTTERPIVSKTRLDEEIVEDADSRHEQFTEEADRWQGEERK